MAFQDRLLKLDIKATTNITAHTVPVYVFPDEQATQRIIID